MSDPLWLGSLKTTEFLLQVYKKNGEIHVTVDSDMPVRLTEDSLVVKVGDVVEVTYHESNEIVNDDSDSDAETNMKAYALVTSVNHDDRTIMGLWVYEKSELQSESRLLRANMSRILTTHAFETPVEFDSIEVQSSVPSNIAPRVLLWETKKLDETMTFQCLQSILATADHFNSAQNSSAKRQKLELFHLPGHVRQYKEVYDNANEDQRKEMTKWATLLYSNDHGLNWDKRVNELNIFAQRLSEAAAR